MKKTPIDWPEIAKDWDSFVELHPHTDHRELHDQFWDRKGGVGKFFYTEGNIKGMPRGFIEEEAYRYEIFLSKPDEQDLDYMGWREIHEIRAFLNEYTVYTEAEKDTVIENLPKVAVATTDKTMRTGDTLIFVRKNYDAERS